MCNVQFATAIHILAMLANHNGSLSSIIIAESINVDSAIVRRLLRVLVPKGLVLTKEGKGGGASLAKPAKNILLSDVYLAVVEAPLLGRFNNPNPGCNTGRQINQHLTDLYQQAENALVKELSKTTLANFCEKFN
jgi:Rrf2 family protein